MNQNGPFETSADRLKELSGPFGYKVQQKNFDPLNSLQTCMQDQYTTKHRSNPNYLTTRTCISGSDTTDGISRAKCTQNRTN